MFMICWLGAYLFVDDIRPVLVQLDGEHPICEVGVGPSTSSLGH